MARYNVQDLGFLMAGLPCAEKKEALLEIDEACVIFRERGARNAQIEWRPFANGSTANGGAAAHAFSRGPCYGAADLVALGEDGIETEVPVNADAAIERIMQDWLPFWEDPQRCALGQSSWM